MNECSRVKELMNEWVSELKLHLNLAFLNEERCCGRTLNYDYYIKEEDIRNFIDFRKKEKLDGGRVKALRW